MSKISKIISNRKWIIKRNYYKLIMKYIKRLIGLPGDKLQMINSVLHINNKPIKREFVKNDIVFCGEDKKSLNFISRPCRMERLI